MERYQIQLIDPYRNALVAWDFVEADSRTDAIAQRPRDWPRRETRASRCSRNWA